MSGDKVCFDIKRKEIQSCGLHLLVLTIFSPDNYASVAGTIETYLLSSLPTLKLTVPSTKAKRVVDVDMQNRESISFSGDLILPE